MNLKTSWYQLLSKNQKQGLFASLVLVIVIIAVGYLLESNPANAQTFVPDTSLTLKQLAGKLGVTGGSIARELDLPMETKKDVAVASLGVSEETLMHASSHILSHVPSTTKYLVYLAIVIWSLSFLVYTGRPEGADSKERTRWYPQWVYFATLSVSAIFTGFVLGKSPNPMEGIVKVFKTMVGLYPDPPVKIASLCFFLALAFVGNKLICGWACPFGALQELIFSLPILKNMKQKKIPFWFSNGIRSLLFATMLLMLFGIVGGQKGYVLYHPLNPFNIFNLELEGTVMTIAVTTYLVLSFVTYRPFCSFICPFGLASWGIERISINKVRVDHEACTNCKACYKACPNNSIKDRVEKAKFPTDCFSCARCLNLCPVDAITYGQHSQHNQSHTDEGKQ